MMKQAALYSAMLIMCLSLLSCSKEDGKKEEANSSVKMLTSGTWKFSSAGPDLNYDGVKDQELPAGYLSGCETDNTITFKSDLSGVIDEGATRCQTTSPQTVPFTWSLKNDDKDLTISTPLFAGINGDVKIIELTETKLTISKVVPVFGFQANVIVFLTH